MKLILFMIGFAIEAFAASPLPIAEVKLVAPSGTPVGWSRDENRYTLYVGCGPLGFSNEKRESRISDEIYFYAWIWNYQAEEYSFRIIERIDGAPPEIFFVDLNRDGIDEIVLKNVAGAHTSFWHIYRRVGKFHEIEKIGGVFSDWGRILPLEELHDDYSIIEAWQRNYGDQHLVTRSRFIFRNGRFRKEPDAPATPLTPPSSVP